MKKNRELPPLAKPLFDEDAVLAFATAKSGLNRAAATETDECDGQVRVIVPLSPKLYAALQKEATRKGRTAADTIRKILVKHFDD